MNKKELQAATPFCGLSACLMALTESAEKIIPIE
jgi:hypothetical protein